MSDPLVGLLLVGLLFVVLILLLGRLFDGPAKVSRFRNDAAYWRSAYETLVRQTGRDLNDGLGLDPRKESDNDR